MGDDFERDPWHVNGEPCKNVRVSLKSFGQFAGAFRIQPRTDLHLPLRILVVKGYGEELFHSFGPYDLLFISEVYGLEG